MLKSSQSAKELRNIKQRHTYIRALLLLRTHFMLDVGSFKERE